MATTSGRCGKILIVDDEPLALERMQVICNKLSHIEVVEIGRGSCMERV